MRKTERPLIPADTASLLKSNRRGILYMCAAMAFFLANDSLVKYASQTMASAQLIFLRGVMATVLVLALVRTSGAMRQAGEILRGWVAVRAWVDAAGTFIYLVALFHLPLVNATAIIMTSPLFIAGFAAVYLGERGGTGRWLAIALGFLGVLLIIQPRAEGFNVMNHTNFGTPNAGVFVLTPGGGGSISPTAGRITTVAGDARRMQFAIKFLF